MIFRELIVLFKDELLNFSKKYHSWFSKPLVSKNGTRELFSWVSGTFDNIFLASKRYACFRNKKEHFHHDLNANICVTTIIKLLLLNFVLNKTEVKIKIHFANFGLPHKLALFPYQIRMVVGHRTALS